MTRPDTDWTWGNDTPCWLKPRRNICFIYRIIHGKVEYLLDKRGRMRQWRSQEAVKKALKKLAGSKRSDP